MPQRFLKNSTVKLSETLQQAIMELANLRKSVMNIEFILLALVEQKDSIVLKVFDELKLDAGMIRREIVDHVITSAAKLPDMTPAARGNIKISQEVQRLFELANEERQKLADAYISTGATFLAFFAKEFGTIKPLFEKLGLTYEATTKALQRIRGSKRIDRKDDESRLSLLEEYTTDVTAMARKGLLDPVIGREQEINRVIEILSRRKKNNPVLIGEPGVGKTVIVEGLARQIVAADVPEHLLSKRILSLEMGTLIAGAKMQGEFEDRLKKIIEEVVASEGQIILFIDELHTVVGTGRSGGGLDASNMLKPALARGVLQCIGATTTREYKQYIESDKALERRFQPVRILEPSIEQTIAILTGLKDHYESHHQIQYQDSAIESAARLSAKYLTERYLPDKAIDLLDEAGAAKRLKVVYAPPEVRALDGKRQELLTKKSEAFHAQDFEQMAYIQMELSRVEANLLEQRRALASTVSEAERSVGEDDIAAIISRTTGIPAAKLIAEEADKLASLESRFSARVIGQRHVIDSVASAIKRNRAGLRKADRPVASFLFLGPTGVGKTELAKAIAHEVMDDENKIVRVDMSEYMEKHTVSKLIGAPPGYVGYGEGGQLTEKVRRNPYSVVLFDEFEKAHPDVYNILLQLLDEGWLTDGEGHKVSFRNCVVIGTSNIGSEILTDRKRPVGIGSQTEDWDADDERDAIMKEVRNFLRPEFLNRLDEVVIFNRLTRQDLEKILDLQLADLQARLAEQHLSLRVAPSVRNFLIEGVERLGFGARPLRRNLEKHVENAIATLLIGDRPKPESTIEATLGEGGKVLVSSS